MRTLIAVNLCVSLALVSPVPAHAKVVEEKVHHQFMVEQVTSRLIQRLNSARTGTEAARIIIPYLPSTEDQKFAEAVLAKIKKFPKFQRLNRGYSFEYNGQKMVVVAEDIFTSKYRLNDKVDFKYSRENPLSVQMETVFRGLKEKKTALSGWIVPEAEAAIDPVSLAVGAAVTVFIGLIVMPLGEMIRDEYIRPRWDAYYCEGKDQNDYRFNKSCASYWAHRARQRAGLPQANPAPPGIVVQPLTPQPPKCYTEESPTFVQRFQSADESVLIERTVEYKDRKPTQVVERSIKPPADATLNFLLNDKGQLHEVLEGSRITLTRDPKKSEMMNAEKFKQMETHDKVIADLLQAINLCDEAARLAQAATQPGSLVARQVLTDSLDSVPAPRAPPATAK